MGKHSPNEKHPDGKGNRAGGGVCGSCSGTGGRWEAVSQVRNGKPEKVDVRKTCGACGGSGRK